MAKVFSEVSFSGENKFNQTSADENMTTRRPLEFSKDKHELIKFNSLTEESHRSFAEKAFCGEIGSKPPKSSVVLQDFQWEYTIVLPNPDYPGYANQVITKEEAREFYKSCFKGKKSGNLQRDSLNYLNEVQAFDSAFETLEDLGKGKKFRFGGRMKFNDNSVVDENTSAKDFLSLVRNVIFYKLVASLSLKVKQILSRTGEFVYFVITADESDLMIEAQRTRFNKQLEIALTDIQSLIPCDSNLRPLHLLKTDDEEIRELYEEIKPFLRRAFGLDKHADRVEYKLEPCGVTTNMWNAYKVYLGMLKDGINKIMSSVGTHKNQMFLFQKIIKDSIDKVNLGLNQQDRLQNLWERMNINKPIAPYAEFRRSEGDDEFDLMWRTHEISESGKRSLFRNMERLRLIVSYIETEVSLNFLQDKGVIVAHYPFHNIWQLKGKNTNSKVEITEEDKLLKNILFDFKSADSDGPLIRCWQTSLINQKIPLSKIRNYFGEKIALYFEFLRYYQVSLFIPGLFGILVFVLQRVYNDDEPVVLAFNAIYSVFMTVWATVFLEGWKRKESSLSIMWGTTKYEHVEVPRPQYQGIKRRSPITDEMEEIYFPPSKRIKFIILAVSVSLLILSLVLGIVAGLIVLKWRITDSLIIGGFNLAGPICSVLNAVQIIFFNTIYGKLAKMLTDMENHRTENQYQDSYILKVFAFQFVNAFNSLCYIAFIKGYTEECIATDSSGAAYRTKNCMNELYTQLISIFIVSYVKNLVEVGQPYFKYKLKKNQKMKNKLAQVSHNSKDIRDKVDSQLCLDYYITTDVDGTIDDYMELAILFGYLSLFAMAFPLSTSLAYVGLWFEMHTDKLKVLHLVRRPLPLSSKDIGTWLNIFSITSVFAIFSNTALFCFTANTFENIPNATDYKYIIFAAVVIVLLIFRNQIQSWIPDVPESFEIVKARHDYIVEKVLRGDVKEEIETNEEIYDAGMYFSTENLKFTEYELDF